MYIYIWFDTDVQLNLSIEQQKGMSIKSISNLSIEKVRIIKLPSQTDEHNTKANHHNTKADYHLRGWQVLKRL
jgi:type III secretory pathway lipoprotein EscJ